MKHIVTTTIVVTIGLLASVVKGWALMTLWSWFLTPIGLPDIGLAHAIGIGVIISLTTYQLDAKPETPDRTPTEAAIASATVALAGMIIAVSSVGFGYVLTHFM